MGEDHAPLRDDTNLDDSADEVLFELDVGGSSMAADM